MIEIERLAELPEPYFEDDHTIIYHCKLERIVHLFKDKSFGLVLTDPPYEAEAHKVSRRVKSGTIAKEALPFGKMTEELRRLAVSEAKRLSTGWSLIFCQAEAIGKYQELMGPRHYRRPLLWCLSGGTMVYAKTLQGEHPLSIKDLIRQDLANVSLWNGERWTKITGAWPSTSIEDRQITLRSGERINCTASHRWPTQRGVIPCEELVVGDILQSCVLPEPETPIRPAALDDRDIGWFVGLWIAEGSRSGNSIRISGHLREADRLERLTRIVSAYGGTIHTYPTSELGLDAHISSPILSAVVDMYVSGRDAKSKYPSVHCWRRSNAFLDALLEGYLDGDGHYDERNQRYRLGFTRNRYLEGSLRTLCARLGYSLRVRPTWSKIGEIEYPSFRGEIHKSRSTHPNARRDAEIVEIATGTGKQYWDIGVEDDPHLFALASGILTHNSKPDAPPQLSGDRPSMAFESIVLSHHAEYDPATEDDYETAVASWHAEGRSEWNGRGKRGVYTHRCTNYRHDHPTQKSLPLIEELLADFCIDDTMPVIDFFAGACTTAVACRKRGIVSVMIEMDEEWCEVGALRCEAIHAGSGGVERNAKAKQRSFADAATWG